MNFEVSDMLKHNYLILMPQLPSGAVPVGVGSHAVPQISIPNIFHLLSC